MLSVVRCDKELEILHAVYLSVIILLVIIIIVLSVIHWRIRRDPGNRITCLTTIKIKIVIESSKVRANLKRHNRVYILSSKHSYRPMRARVEPNLFYNSSS